MMVMKRFAIDRSIPYLMNRIVGRLNRRLHDRLSVNGLTFQHWRVLASLSVRERPTIAEIAEYAVIPHSTLSRLLTRMESEGLIRRIDSKGDLRVAHIVATPKGKRVFQRIIPHAVEIRNKALVHFSRHEEERLRALLIKMLDDIPGGDKEPAG
jgi:DNA-binding MarR family transcriptional regulator